MELLPVIKQQFFDDNGDPLSGGFLYSYLASSSSPAETYLDEAGTPNTNPIELDSAGRCDLRVSNSTSYKFILKNSLGVTIWTVDDVSAASSSGGGSDPGALVEFEITDGQSATDLDGMTLDFTNYSSADYMAEIRRGTTVAVNIPFAVQNLNGTGRVCLGVAITEESHGLTFTVSQASTVVQLRAAADTGAGNGTLKIWCVKRYSA